MNTWIDWFASTSSSPALSRSIVVGVMGLVLATAGIAVGSAAEISNITITSNNTTTSFLGNITTGNLTIGNVTNTGQLPATAAGIWAAIASLQRAMVPPPGRARYVQEEISRLREIANLAHVLYTKHPGDATVPKARKLEAVSTLESVQLGGAQYRADALALATAYRAEKKNPASDRFDVALATEILAAPATLQGKRLSEKGEVAEAIADRLYSEFGDLPQVFGFYSSIVRTNDVSTAVRLVAKLKQRNAPADVQAEAQGFANRGELTGKGVSGLATKFDGTKLDISLPRGHPTIIYLWSQGSAEADLAALKSIDTPVPNGFDWLYIGLGMANLSDADLSSRTPFPGAYCAETGGFDSPIAQALQVRQTPWVCVLNGAGMVTGSGRVEDLPGLLSGAAK